MSEIEMPFECLLFMYLLYLFIRELKCKKYKSKCNIYLTLCRINGNMALCTGNLYGGENLAKNLSIKAARAQKDMTQKDLADAVGVSRQTVNAIEKGEYNPTIKLCRKICRVLEKSLDDLFWEDDGDE